MAVDSRAAAPHAPGPVPRASLPPHRARHGPLVRRRGATAIGPTTRRRGAVDAPQKAAPPARASRMSVGVAAHVFSGNCGVVRRSEPRNPRADCVLGHGVATALRHGFLPRLRLCPLAPTALRLSEQVQGNLDAVRAVCGGTARGGSAAKLFLRYFFIARNSEASERLGRGRIRHKPLETTPKRPLPGATPPQMTRARSETTATTPLRPGLPPQ